MGMMTNQLLLNKALTFCINKHKGQLRKYTNDPYHTHCVRVMKKLQTVTNDIEMLIAALLHDTVEDTNTTIEEIRIHFGNRVAYLVKGLTDVSKPSDGNRSKRKAMDRNHLAKGCKDIQTIKLADIIDNSIDILKHDAKFAKVYLEEKKLLLKVLKKGHNKLYKEAKRIVDEYMDNR